jgi:outer membrane protein OmpA-like peptidoglycan-associated protein
VQVFFAPNQKIVPAAARQQLLKKVPADATVTVVGYASPKEKHPERTANQRAQAVADFLRKHGRNAEIADKKESEQSAGKAQASRRVDVFLR